MPRLQLAVTFHNDHTRYYPVTFEGGWKTSHMWGVEFLIIGTGIPRTLIPLSGVQSFTITDVAGGLTDE